MPRSVRTTASSSLTAACPTNAVAHLIEIARNGQPVVEKKAKISKKAAAKAAAAAEAAAEAEAEAAEAESDAE